MHIFYNNARVIKMAAFCLECWNNINKTDDPADKYVFSKKLDLCEGCGRWKKVIITEYKHAHRRKFCLLIFPFKIICKILYIIWRVLLLPYFIYQYSKIQRK